MNESTKNKQGSRKVYGIKVYAEHRNASHKQIHILVDLEQDVILYHMNYIDLKSNASEMMVKFKVIT